MIKRIYKYPLDIVGRQTVKVPCVAPEVLSVQFQEGKLCMWAVVDLDQKPQTLQIEIFGTGHELPPGYRIHLGTVIDLNTGLVWHVYQYLNG